MPLPQGASSSVEETDIHTYGILWKKKISKQNSERAKKKERINANKIHAYFISNSNAFCIYISVNYKAILT